MNPPLNVRLSSKIAVTFILCLLAADSRLSAANGTDIWTGGGGSATNWSTGANWTGANTPPINGDSLLFGTIGSGGSILTNNLASTNNFAGLIFSNTAGSFTLIGNQIAASAAIQDNSANPEYVNLPVAYAATHSLTAASGATLQLGGILSGAGGITVNGAGAVILTNANTFTGTTAVNVGNLELNFTGTESNILYSTSALSLGGGTLTVNGSGSANSFQTNNGVSIGAASGAGASSTISVSGTGGNSATLSLGALTVNAGSSVVFNGPATIGAGNASVAATGNILTTTAGSTTTGAYDILVGGSDNNAFATVGLYDWAATTGSTPYIITGGSQVGSFYTADANNTTPANNINWDISAQETPGAPTTEARVSSTGSWTIQSLRFNSPNAPYVTVKGGVYLQSGGVLITPNMGTVNAAIDGLRMAGNGTQIVQNNTKAVFIIGQNGNGGGPFFISSDSTTTEFVTKSGPGSWFIDPTVDNFPMNYTNSSGSLITVGTTEYNYGNTPSGTYAPFYFNGGVSVFNNPNVFGNPATLGTTAGGAGTINLNGGTLMAESNAVLNVTNLTGSPNRYVFLGNNGGGLAALAGKTFTVGGYIENGPGALVIGIPASSANGNVAGLVPGTGTGTLNPTFSATGTVVLTNANGYTGGTVIDTGTLNINGINALGGANYGGLTLNGGTLQYAAGFSGNGSGDLTSIGTAGVTLAANGGTIDVNGNAVSYASAIGNGGSGFLTLLSSTTAGTLTLSGANSYAGTTTISNLTVLANNTAGSALGTNTVNVLTNAILADNGTVSGNVIVNNGGVVGGTGTFGGNVLLNSGAQTLLASVGLTNTVAGNLTYSNGATANFVLTNLATGIGNDQIVLSGSSSILSSSNITVGINCPGTLDELHDYLLFNLTGGSASIVGTFNSTPAWLGATPAGSANFVVLVTNSTKVVLHYAGSVPPAFATFTVTPATAVANQPVNFSATVTLGSGTINSSSGVTVNVSSLGGSATQGLVSDGAGHYTNTVVVGATTIPGVKTLTGTVTDSLGGATSTNISLTINSTNEVWNGGGVSANSNWSNNTNWASLLAPGDNDSLVFAGPTGLSPVLDSSLTITSITFTNGAGAFTLGNSGSSTLTLTGNVTNNSTSAETLNLPVALGAALTLDASAGSLTLQQNITNGGYLLTILDGGQATTLSGALVGTGGLTMSGTGTATLSGANTYSGNTIVNSGTLAITGAGELGGGNYAGNLTDSGTFTFNSSAAQILSGVISGAGAFNMNGGTLILAGANTLSGTTVIAGGTLVDSNSLALQDATLNYNNQGGTLSFATGITAYTLGALTGSQSLTLNNAGGTAITLTLGNSTAVTYSGNLSGYGSLVMAGTGTNILAGTNAIAGSATDNTGVLELTTNAVLDCGSAFVANSLGGELFINGGTLVATNASNIGQNAVGFLMTSGSATFLSNLAESGNLSSGALVQVNGGYLQAASFSMGRGGSYFTNQPAAGFNNAGMYVDGGTVNILGNVDMSSSTSANSSANLRIDAGTLDIGGSVVIGLDNSGRWSVFDVNGGTTTVTNNTTGISVGGPNVGNAELLVRAGLLTSGAITLGYGVVTDTAVLFQTGGSLYVGSGGIVLGSTNATASITLDNALLGASANWSTVLPVQLAGTNYVIQTSDASGNAHSIALDGILSGSSALTVTGNGMLTLGATNTWTGPAAVSNGVVLVNGILSASTNTVTVATNAAFGGTGTVAGSVTYNAGSFAVFTPGSPFTFTNAVTLAGGTLPVVKLSLSASLGAGTYVLATNTASTFTGSFNATPVMLAGSTGTLLPGATATVTTAGKVIKLTVSQAAPLIAASPSATAITYGQALSASTLSDGSVTNAAGTLLSGTFTFTSPATVPGAGSASESVTFTPTDSTDYTPVTGTVSVTVTPAALEITANDATQSYNGIAYSGGNGVIYSGFVNGDSATSLGGSLSYTGTAQGAVSVGSYSIIPSGLTSANYTISYTGGTLTIGQASPAISFSSSLNPAGYLTGVSFGATLSSDATGTVIFSSTNAPFSTNTLTAGAASTLSVTNLPRGTNLITLVYSGDGNYLPATNTLEQVITNHPPVAMNVALTLTAGLPVEISLSRLATNWSDVDGDTVELTAINLTSTNGVSLFPINLHTNLDGSYDVANAYLGYISSTGAADQISYTISDGFGGTTTGYINLAPVSSVTGTNSIASIVVGNPNVLTAYGVPGFSYITQRSTNLDNNVWTDISTNSAATNGLINVNDAFSDLGGNPPASAFYRLLWHP